MKCHNQSREFHMSQERYIPISPCWHSRHGETLFPNKRRSSQVPTSLRHPETAVAIWSQIHLCERKSLLWKFQRGLLHITENGWHKCRHCSRQWWKPPLWSRIWVSINESVILQYNTLGWWAKWLGNQASDVPSMIFFFHNFLQNSLQKSFQFIFLIFL